MNLCLLNRFRVPDRLVLAYPTVNVSKTLKLPSNIYALREEFSSFNFQRFSYDSYTQDAGENAEDYFLLNPLRTPDEVLARFPPTRILGGTYDPARDSFFLFYNRLLKLNVDVRLTEYAFFPSGFLNYVMPVPRLMCGVSKAAVMRIGHWINQCIAGHTDIPEPSMNQSEDDGAAEFDATRKEIGPAQIEAMLKDVKDVSDDEEPVEDDSD